MAAYRLFISRILPFVLLSLLAACSSSEQAPKAKVIKPVKVMTVGEREAGVLRAFPGVVVAGDSVDLGFRVAGQLADFPVREGQQVKEGEIIAQLDKKDYMTSLRNLESRLGGAKASLNEARLNFQRNEQLLKSDTISRSAYDTAKARYENTVSELESLEQQIRQARQNVLYTELRAPFSGTIGTKYVKNFENVQIQQPIVRLQNLDSLDVEVQIPEFVFILFKNYKGATTPPVVRFAAYPDREFSARLKEFQTVPNAQTQTYTVTMTIDAPADIALQPGMTAEVQGKLPPTMATEGYMIPAAAVVGGEGQSKHVWVLGEDMTVHSKAIVTGEMQGADIIVSSGLASGERIVTAGVHYLEEGQQVRILEGPVGGQ